MSGKERYSGPVDVTAVDRVAGDAVVMRLAAPEIAAAAEPGQFVMVRFPQRLDPLLPRPFSAYDVEGDQLLLLIRLVGPTTNRLAEVKAGQTLNVVGPLGTGFSIADGEVRHVLVGGGMGVAPFPLLLKALAKRQADVRMLMGAYGCDGLYTPERLALDRQATITEDGTSGRKGLVTDLLAETPDAAGPATVYACGPEGMLAAVARVCIDRGVPCQLSLEAMMACGTGLCHGCAVRLADGSYARVCKDGPVFSAADLASPWWE